MQKAESADSRLLWRGGKLMPLAATAGSKNFRLSAPVIQLSAQSCNQENIATTEFSKPRVSVILRVETLTVIDTRRLDQYHIRPGLAIGKLVIAHRHSRQACREKNVCWQNVRAGKLQCATFVPYNSFLQTDHDV